MMVRCEQCSETMQEGGRSYYSHECGPVLMTPVYQHIERSDKPTPTDIRTELEWRRRQDAQGLRDWLDAGVRHRHVVNTASRVLDHLLGVARLLRGHSGTRKDGTWGELEKHMASILTGYVLQDRHLRMLGRSIPDLTSTLVQMFRAGFGYTFDDGGRSVHEVKWEQWTAWKTFFANAGPILGPGWLERVNWPVVMGYLEGREIKLKDVPEDKQDKQQHWIMGDVDKPQISIVKTGASPWFVFKTRAEVFDVEVHHEVSRV